MSPCVRVIVKRESRSDVDDVFHNKVDLPFLRRAQSKKTIEQQQHAYAAAREARFPCAGEEYYRPGNTLSKQAYGSTS